MDTGRNPSDRGDNSLFERFGNRKKVGVALGIVAALGISGCSQEVGANPSPVETSTSQTTKSTEDFKKKSISFPVKSLLRLSKFNIELSPTFG